jgi:hypothetical protein
MEQGHGASSYQPTLFKLHLREVQTNELEHPEAMEDNENGERKVWNAA